MSDKKRFDYTTLGLIKKDDITTFNEQGINDIPECRDYLANYGLFVIMTRSLAGHEKDSLVEKKAILTETFKWFTDKMPKRVKKVETPEEKAAREKATTITMMRKAVENGTAAEKKMVEQIVSKM
jgi:hypothetical protein